MKVLIVGKDSYIGNHIDEWLTGMAMQTAQLDVRKNGWQDFDYSSYDVLVYVAAIVHRKDADEELYQKVNVQLPLEIAALAKKQGVKQFVFLSSMAVYGGAKTLSAHVIDRHSPLTPDTPYGKSKLMAEEGLSKLGDEAFRLVILRLPNVYGKGCKGNYISGFTFLVRMLPVIPRAYTHVRQSLIYIDNLCELVRLLIVKGQSGIYCPQDEVAVSAGELMRTVADGLGLRRSYSSLSGGMVKLFRFLPVVKKIFGGLEYDRSLSEFPDMDYVVVPFSEAMRKTVSQKETR